MHNNEKPEAAQKYNNNNQLSTIWHIHIAEKDQHLENVHCVPNYVLEALVFETAKLAPSFQYQPQNTMYRMTAFL